MERVGVVIAVGNARDDTVFLAVDPDEAAGQALCRSRDQREIQMVLLARLIHALAHMADDLKAEVLRLLALAVMTADERLKAFRKADEAERQRAVLQHLAYLIVRAELLRVDPHALAHEERVVTHALSALNAEAIEQLVDDKVDLAVKILEEPVQIAVTADRDARQVDRRERQVAAAVGDLAGRVNDIGHDARAAAHVADLGLRMTGLVIFQIERCVEEREVREHALGGNAAGELEQIVVRVAVVVVDAFLDLEDVDREDRRLSVAEAGLGREQQLLHDQTALRRGIRTVVERGERDLRARTGVHGIEVVHQSLHRLIGALARLLVGVLAREFHALRDRLFVHSLGKRLCHRLVIAVVAGEAGPFAGLLLDALGQLSCIHLIVVVLAEHLERLGEVAAEQLAEGLAHTRRHGVIEVRNRLAAVLIVLVGLDRDARQSRIGADVVRLTQEVVTGRKAVAEQLQQIDLAAGGGQREKIQIVNVDVAVAVRRCMRRVKDEHLVKLLCALRAVLEHGAHRGIAVDIGVLALDVVLDGGLEGQILVDLHQTGIHLTHARTLVAVQDVFLRGAGVAALDEHGLDRVLNLFYRRDFLADSLFKLLFDLLRQLVRHLVILAADRLRRAEDRVRDFIQIKRSRSAVSLDNLLYHNQKSLSHTKTALRRLLNFVVLPRFVHRILCSFGACKYYCKP